MRTVALCLVSALAGLVTPAQAFAQTPLEARTAAVQNCMAKPRTTYSRHTECLLAADKAFFEAIGYNDPPAWARYTARMRQAAADADAGKLTEDQFAAQMLAIKGSFKPRAAI